MWKAKSKILKDSLLKAQIRIERLGMDYLKSKEDWQRESQLSKCLSGLLEEEQSKIQEYLRNNNL